MGVAWPDGVPYLLKRSGAGVDDGERVIRSSTDSGLARQRAAFTDAPDVFKGTLKMTSAQLAAFRAWRKGLMGAVFTWPAHPLTGDPAEARFIAGQQGTIEPDSQTARFNVPVVIEIVG